MGHKHEISLTLIQGSDGSPYWQMDYGGKKYSPNGYPTIDLPYDSKSHEFQFTIVNPGSITFKDGTGADSPIYIMETKGKPSVGVVNSQIENISLSADKTVLSFKDKNKGRQRTLSYQLNFDGACPLDPIIQNGGGTGGREFAILAIAAGVAVISYFAYLEFFK